MTSSPDTSTAAAILPARTEPSWSALADTLDALCATAQELEPVLREKQQALVGNHLHLIELLVARESELSARLNALECQRQIAVVELAQSSGIDEPGLRLGELLELTRAAAATPEQQAVLEEVAALAGELVDRLRRLEQLNADNGFLSRNLLEYTQFVLELVHNGTGQPAYRSDGKMSAAASGHDLLDYRV